MHYHYEFGATRERGGTKRGLLAAVFVAVIVAALYGGLLCLSPRLVAMPLTPKADANATAQQIENTKPKANALYIPQLNVDVPVTIGGTTSGPHGAWQQDKSKDAAKGDVVQICAPSFKLGVTPWQTRQHSPFYNLDRLAEGDQLVLDYKGNRYEYKVTAKSEALPSSTAAAKEPGLVVFACDAAGEQTGVALEAKMVGGQTAKKESSSSLW